MCKDCYCKLAEYYGGIRKFRGICGMKNWKTDYVAQAESNAFSLEKFYQNIRSGKIRGIKGITNVDTFRMYRKKDPYYRDLGWAKYAYELKKANGFKCEECGKVFIDAEGNYIEKSLQVHHVDKNPLNVSLDNHKVLCVECHRKEHMGKVYVDVE
jgi:phosphoribosyl 1,2-cyclic phosphodiesterase